MDAYNDGDIEDHVGNVTRLAHPKGDNQLTKGGAKRIGESCQCRCSHPATGCEPEIRVSGRRGEHKRLGQPRENLTEHDDPKVAAIAGVTAAIADPVAGEDECGRSDDGRSRPKVQHIDNHWRDEDEGEEECGAEPVDGVFVGAKVFGRVFRYRGKGEPLKIQDISQ